MKDVTDAFSRCCPFYDHDNDKCDKGIKLGTFEVVEIPTRDTCEKCNSKNTSFYDISSFIYSLKCWNCGLVKDYEYYQFRSILNASE